MRKPNILFIILAIFSFFVGLLCNYGISFFKTDYLSVLEARIVSINDDFIEVKNSDIQESYEIPRSSIGIIFNNKFRPMNYSDLKVNQNVVIQFHIKRFGKRLPKLVDGEILTDVETILIK